MTETIISKTETGKVEITFSKIEIGGISKNEEVKTYACYKVDVERENTKAPFPFSFKTLKWKKAFDVYTEFVKMYTRQHKI